MDSSGSGRYIPKYLDAQPQLFWWELDEGLILIGGLCAGIIFDNRIIFIGIALIIQRIYAKLINDRQPGYLHHKMYALGLTAKLQSNKIKKDKIPEFYNKYFIK